MLMGNAVDTFQPISSEIPDWTREEPSQFWDPGRKLLRTIRRYQSWQQRRGLIGRIFLQDTCSAVSFWSVVTGADIPLNCQIGGGLLIPHPNGIVIHPEAKIGVNCLIFQQVTIGIRNARGSPEISGHVDIGAGAKILGGIKIGAHARIGANAVVFAMSGMEWSQSETPRLTPIESCSGLNTDTHAGFAATPPVDTGAIRDRAPDDTDLYQRTPLDVRKYSR